MNLFHCPRRIAQLLILLYQHTLSLDHGPLSRLTTYQICRYRPTCSEYGYEAIGRFGLLKGGWKTLKRLFRCTPWHPGGNDPVPHA